MRKNGIPILVSIIINNYGESLHEVWYALIFSLCIESYWNRSAFHWKIRYSPRVVFHSWWLLWIWGNLQRWFFRRKFEGNDYGQPFISNCSSEYLKNWMVVFWFKIQRHKRRWCGSESSMPRNSTSLISHSSNMLLVLPKEYRISLKVICSFQFLHCKILLLLVRERHWHFHEIHRFFMLNNNHITK